MPAAAKSLQSCLTLCDPIDGSPPGLPIPGILQRRTLEWVAISFSNVWKWKVKVKSLSCVGLFVTAWTAAYQAPLSMGFSRQEYWRGLPLPFLRFLRKTPLKKKNAPLHTHAHTKPINARLYYTHWIQKPMISESSSVSHTVIIVCFSLLFYFYLVQISSLVPETIKEEQKTYDSFYYAYNYQFCFLVVRLITLIFR